MTWEIVFPLLDHYYPKAKHDYWRAEAPLKDVWVWLDAIPQIEKIFNPPPKDDATTQKVDPLAATHMIEQNKINARRRR